MWYFNSWAVLDGQAFVSKRNADSVEAGATVFLSVPDLEAVPIGRISTALRAQRSCFQDGFRDPDSGAEFEFDNLDQVREIIRRAYLGGGLAPVPTPIEGPPLSPFRSEMSEPWEPPPAGSGGAYYDETTNALRQQLDPTFLPINELSDRLKRRAVLERVHHSVERLEPYLRAFAIASLLELFRENRSVIYLPSARDTLISWDYLLRCLGYLTTEMDLMRPLRLLIGSSHWPDWRRDPQFHFDKGILFHIPCPLRKSWNRHIQSLAHTLLLPIADNKHFESYHELEDFIPTLFSATVVVLSRELVVSPIGPFGKRDRFRLVGRACEWLLNELPRVALSTEVEAELTKFAHGRLSMNRNRA